MSALCVCQVGLLVATSQLDIGLLLQSFDLGPFDGFLPADVYEACEAAAQVAAAAKVKLGAQHFKADPLRDINGPLANHSMH